MSKLEMIKLGSGVMTGIGSAVIVGGAVNSLVPRRNNVEKLFVFCGQLALASVVTDVVRKHTDKTVDDIVAWLDKNAKG